MLSLSSTANFQSIYKNLRFYGVDALGFKAFKVVLYKIYPLYNYFYFKLVVIIIKNLQFTIHNLLYHKTNSIRKVILALNKF